MDHEIARRRVSRILCHVTSMDNEQLSSPNSHLFPLNCSSTLNSMVHRCDNTLLFARQGSASQAYFMRQISIKQNSNPSDLLSEGGDCFYQYQEKPLFSRQIQTHCSLPTLKAEQFVNQDCRQSSSEVPKFARQYTEKNEKADPCCNRASHIPLSKGIEWSPRIDVAESGANYVVTVELPGVSIMDIRVEVDDHRLIVTGKRSANGSDGANITYHRKEIMQGPYRVFWPLPNNVNKDMASAEFVNGFLKITLPKL